MKKLNIKLNMKSCVYNIFQKFKTMEKLYFICVNHNHLRSIILFFSLISAAAATASNGDSLALSDVIKQVLQNYPSVKSAEEAITAADAKIKLAQTAYYPDANVDASYTRLGPASGINFPGLGFFSLYPLNNYNADLSVNENIYDFGKTARNVNYEKESKNLSLETLEQTKQKLALIATNTFYNISYLQDAIEIKNEQLKDLKEHLDFINKKKETGSATQYEILSTKVRISNAESQKVDLESGLKVQLTVLNSILGQPENTIHYAKKDLNLNSEIVNQKPDDSLISFAINHRDEMKIAQEKTILAELNYKVIKSKNNPVINAFAAGGWKNGFFPDLNTLTANYAAGIAFKYPLFDAFRTKNNLLLAKSTINTSGFETDMTKRTITNEVVENRLNINAAHKKIDQFTLQLEQAKQAKALAETSFKAGAITNLDLLDATTTVSESRLSLLKSQIDYILSIYKLKMAMGERLY